MFYFLNQSCVKLLMTTQLVTGWRYAPFGHIAQRHCAVLGWRMIMRRTYGQLKDHGPPVHNNKIPSVAFQEGQFPNKYHNFRQWLYTSIFFFRSHRKMFLQTEWLNASTSREEGSSWLAVCSHAVYTEFTTSKSRKIL